jgi:hypothetical protein
VKTYGYIPLGDDYDHADRILEKALEITKYNKKLDKETANNMFVDLHSAITFISETYKTSRILNAIPRNASIIETVMDDGGTEWQDYNRSIVDLKWLEENGQCMDNIKAGYSSIPDAGRGAFASRFIPTGGLVAPAPLVHIKDRGMIKTYFDYTYNKDSYSIPDRDGPSSYQLIINYCFGHQESTLLLCPYGVLTSRINHSRDTPNTRIVWAKEMRHKDWMSQPIERWGDEYHTGLQFDFVALRDIQPDEEILIDYGRDWQEAWEHHVKTFVPPSSDYVPAYELNKKVYELELRTEDEREYELDGVQMHCRWHYLRQRGIPKPRGADDPACRIVRKLGEDSFLVRLIHRANREDRVTLTPGKLVWGIPQDAFFFTDLKYSRDHHQRYAFRHEMQIPDEMFPEIWKNAP